MTDIAKLGIEIETKGLDEARRKLNFVEKEAQRLGITVEDLKKRYGSFVASAERSRVGVEVIEKRVSQAAANYEKMRAATEAAALANGKHLSSQQKVIQSLERKIAAVNLSGKELAVHTALTRANTTANTAAGQRIAALAAQHHALAQAQNKSGAMTAFFTRAMTPLLAFFAGGQAVSALGRMFDQDAKIGETARKIDMTTESLQGFRKVVAETGGDVNAADGAMENFTKRVGEAATGQGYLLRLFEANSVSLRDANGQLRSNTDLWRDFVDIVSRADNANARMRMTTRVLGEEGAKTVNALAMGPAALQRRYRELAEEGRILTDKQIEQADRYNKAVDRISDTFSVKLKSAIYATAQASETLLDGVERKLNEIGSSSIWLKIANALPKDPTNKWFGVEDIYIPGQLPMNEDSGDAFSGRVVNPIKKPSRDPGTDTGNRISEIERAIKTAEKHIAVQRAEAQAIDATAGQHARLRVEAVLLEAAQQTGGDASVKYAEKIKEIGAEAERVANQIAQARLQSDLLFERAQMGRTEIDRRIFETLRSAKIDPDSGMGRMLAEQIRYNEELLVTRNLSADVARGLVSDWRRGADAAEMMANALSRVADKIADIGVDYLISGMFGNFLKPSAGLSGVGVPGSMTSGAGWYHGGGIAGVAGHTRQIHPAYFEDAVRFHTGGIPGLGPNEKGIVVENDEEILTRNDPRHRMNGGKGGVTVNLAIDARGAQQGVADDIVKRAKAEIIPMIVPAVIDAKSRRVRGL